MFLPPIAATPSPLCLVLAQVTTAESHVLKTARHSLSTRHPFCLLFQDTP